MDRFAVNCSRSIHTKVYYCTFISHYNRHQRVLARWNDAIVVLFVFVVVSSFFFLFVFFSLLGFAIFFHFHGFALHIIRISSNTIGTRLIVSVAAAGRIISCDSCMWCRFSVLVYTGTTMLLACFVFFCVLPFLAFPCSSWFFFSTALLCTSITSPYLMPFGTSIPCPQLEQVMIRLGSFPPYVHVVSFTISVHGRKVVSCFL